MNGGMNEARKDAGLCGLEGLRPFKYSASFLRAESIYLGNDTRPLQETTAKFLNASLQKSYHYSVHGGGIVEDAGTDVRRWTMI